MRDVIPMTRSGWCAFPSTGSHELCGSTQSACTCSCHTGPRPKRARVAPVGAIAHHREKGVEGTITAAGRKQVTVELESGLIRVPMERWLEAWEVR